MLGVEETLTKVGLCLHDVYSPVVVTGENKMVSFILNKMMEIIV